MKLREIIKEEVNIAELQKTLENYNNGLISRQKFVQYFNGQLLTLQKEKELAQKQKIDQDKQMKAQQQSQVKAGQAQQQPQVKAGQASVANKGSSTGINQAET